MRRMFWGGIAGLGLAIGWASGQAPAPAPKAAPTPKAKGKADLVPGYERRVIEGFQVLINRKVLSEIEQAKGKYEIEPLEVLENEFKALNQILLPKLLKILQGVVIWVEWDETPKDVNLSEEQKSRGGRVVAVYRSGSGMAAARSFAEGKVSHPGKMNAVEVMTLKRLTEMHQPGKEREQIILLHELCHTVHHVFLTYENPDVKRAYQQAMDRKLYENAYAKTSDAEYFAEISCAYLDRCNYAPHTAEELKELDPVGYKLMEQVWGKQEMIVKAREKAAKEREARAKLKRGVFAVGAGNKSATPTPPAATASGGEPKSGEAKSGEAKSGEAKAGDPEKAATLKLDLIRSLIQDGKKDRAAERLRELMQAYPNTRAAREAAQLLAELSR